MPRVRVVEQLTHHVFRQHVVSQYFTPIYRFPKYFLSVFSFYFVVTCNFFLPFGVLLFFLHFCYVV